LSFFHGSEFFWLGASMKRSNNEPHRNSGSVGDMDLLQKVPRQLGAVSEQPVLHSYGQASICTMVINGMLILGRNSTMQIRTSEDYYGEKHCPLDDCHRNYCADHRLLWRDHETAEQTSDGAGQVFFEMRECPECVAQSLRRKYAHVA
jgi:hypothetical protein